MLRFERLVEAGGHSAVRVIFRDAAKDSRPLVERVTELRSRLRDLGCPSELSHIPRLIAIDVPPEVEYKKVLEVLEPGERLGFWGYEESALAHSD